MMEKALLKQEAEIFIQHLYKELGKDSATIVKRMQEIESEIDEKGYYEHSGEELENGARLAWRNSNRCIGRLFWERLEVVDARQVETEEDVFTYLFDHIKQATNQGKIKPMITIFKPEIQGCKKVRIWNHQLLRYAGYRTEDGMIGDPDSVAFTEECTKLGWKGKGSHFDILPLVVQIGDHEPVFREIPEELIIEVAIEHPDFSLFGDFQVKWYAVPIISDMRLEIGGIQYVAAPFNGWYMGTEIGARNLADVERYNLLPTVAKQMGLDIGKESTLWKDRALVELNAAVLSSFRKHGVTIVDHHTAAKQFKMFEQQEEKAKRNVTGNWTWLIPPLSPAATHIFHKPYNNSIEKPNYFYQKKCY